MSGFRRWLERRIFCEKLTHRFSVYRKGQFKRYARVCEKCGKLWRPAR